MTFTDDPLGLCDLDLPPLGAKNSLAGLSFNRESCPL